MSKATFREIEIEFDSLLKKIYDKLILLTKKGDFNILEVNQIINIKSSYETKIKPKGKN